MTCRVLTKFNCVLHVAFLSTEILCEEKGFSKTAITFDPTDCTTTLTDLRTKFENAFHSEFEERMQNYTRYDAQSFYDAMIFNMDSPWKYMLELILHQQRTPQLLKQKKLIQTQKDHSHPIPALNVDSLKVDFVVIQNTCSEKEDILSKDDLKGTRIEHGFKRAFMSLFGQDVDTFTSTMLLNVDQLQKQLDKDEFQEEDPWQKAFLGCEQSVPKSLSFKVYIGYDSQMTNTTLCLHWNSRFNTSEYTTPTPGHKRVRLIRVKPLEANLVDTKKHQDRLIISKMIAARSGEWIQIANDAYIRPIMTKSQWLRNKAKIEKEIDVLETMNIELEHSVATLRNGKMRLLKTALNKDLYDSIKITRSKTTEQTTSFLANNAELKAQIQEKIKPRTTMSTEVHQAAETVTTSNELDVLFGPLFDKYFKGENQVILKSSAVNTTDA
ncbi:hypothetical protein Tco_0682347 [Tanacetum coccineum]|uniref:Uncharacterized protein n=1 Tax=Tanacetum coccineum TaxID=301880 RepID=A0ABQ4XSJ1_9ASTR